MQKRQKGFQNEYEFQQFFYDFLAGTAKGVLNSAWNQAVIGPIELEAKALELLGEVEGEANRRPGAA